MMCARQMVCALVLSAGLLSAQCLAAESSEDPQETVGARLLRITNEMWFLLSGIADKSSADAAADRFSELAEQSSAMSDRLFDADAQALDVEALDQDTYRIAEAYEDVSYEFESLCRAHCYGSARLVSAFLAAMRLGVFSDDGAELLQTTSLMLSEWEARNEILRLKGLEQPDAELLRVLSAVHDSRSASAAVAELSGLADRLRLLLPENRLRPGNFPEKERANLAHVCSQLEPLLWKIRSEIVRIVSLPGYDDDHFDTFSDALDSVFESLSDTHAECFDDVFDESFRSDLDDALHESITSSQ